MENEYRMITSNPSEEAIGTVRNRKQIVLEAFDGSVKAGYRIQDYENGRKHDVAISVGGSSGVTVRFEAWEEDDW